MQHLRHWYHKYQHLATIQNISLVIAGVIAASWIWGSVATLQKNYAYQREVDENAYTIELMKLQNKNYEYMQAYYRSDEFLELSAREQLGLAKPGEKLVLLPSSEHITDTTASSQPALPATADTESNASKWFQLLFGKRT